MSYNISSQESWLTESGASERADITADSLYLATSDLECGGPAAALTVQTQAQGRHVLVGPAFRGGPLVLSVPFKLAVSRRETNGRPRKAVPIKSRRCRRGAQHCCAPRPRDSRVPLDSLPQFSRTQAAAILPSWGPAMPDPYADGYGSSGLKARKCRRADRARGPVLIAHPSRSGP